MEGGIDLSVSNPLTYNVSSLGDMNVVPPNMQLFEYHSPTTTLEHAGMAPLVQRCPFQSCLDKLTEIESACPTRYNTESDSGTILDRILTSTTAHFFTLCKVPHTVEQDPKTLFKSGLSDHAPVAVSFLFNASPPSGEGAINSEIFTHWTYRLFLERLAWEEDFLNTDFEDELHELRFFERYDESCCPIFS